MRTVVHPRGRLPARVYWVRRSLVVLTALALVFAVGRLLGGGSGSSPSASRAAVTASTPSPTPSSGVAGPVPLRPGGSPAQPPATQAQITQGATQPAGSPDLLAAPSGPCALDEISVTPTVPSAAALGPVDLVLQLTGIKPACTFAVSTSTLVAKVSSGKDRIWSSQDCPSSIKPASVVVRSGAPTDVVVTWNGRRSDPECSRATPWAVPGYYHLAAAVIGSEPNDTQFQLSGPPRPVITKTATPHPKKGTGTVCGGDNAATSCKH